MASLTIRKLDESLKTQLRLRAARNARSMEDEARKILRSALTEENPSEVDLGTEIHRRFAKFKIVDLDIPPRGPARPLPRFDK